MTRRRFLRGSGLAVGGLVAGPSLLAACGDDSDDSGSDGGDGDVGGNAQTITKGSGTADDNDVYHANWTGYLDDETPTTEHARVEGHDCFTHDELAVFLRKAGFDVTLIPNPKLLTTAGWFFATRVSRPALVRDRLQWHWHGLKYKMARQRKAG